MSDKTIVFITGANCGIGYSTAQAVASASPTYHTIIGSRSLPLGEEALQSLQSLSLPGSLSLQQIDITSDSSIAAAASSISKEYGRVDILINNAGVASRAETYAERLRQDFAVNAIGSALVTEGFKDLVLKGRAKRVVYVSSLMGSIGVRTDKGHLAYGEGYESYRASKAALNMLAACDQKNLEEHGVKVQMICPGYVQSNLSGKSEEARKWREDRGATSSDVSAQTILAAIEGKRDDLVGGFFNKEGPIPW